jgi:hypothetical protein
MRTPERRTARPIGARRAVCGALAALAFIAGCAAQRAPATPDAGGIRHTVSESTQLVPAAGPGNTWLLAGVRREIWIARDGSGRLAQSYSGAAGADAAENAEWIAQGRPKPAGPALDERFGPGGLLYVSLDDFPADADTVAKRLTNPAASAGEVLRRASSLLSETMPAPAVVDGVILALRKVEGVLFEETADRLTVSAADTGDPRGTVVTLVFDKATHRLVAERRVATRPIDGLSPASLPIALLDQRITLSEVVGAVP